MSLQKFFLGHTWRKFVRPSELARDVRAFGGRPIDTTGLVFNPLDNRWRLATDVDANYFLTACFEQE